MENDNVDDVNDITFVMIRHINSSLTNNYWIECYNCIRKHYPNNKIIIVDSNSNYDYVTEIELINTEIVRSEFKGRGEILGYYYFHKKRLSKWAFIIQDSFFIQKKIDFGNKTNFMYFFIYHIENDNI